MIRTSTQAFRSLSTCYGTAIFLLAAGAVSPTSAATLQVDQNNAACSNIVGAPYCAVQAAINAASSGDLVRIAQGDYIEAITITRDLTLAGEGIGLTVLRSPGFTSTVTVQFLVKAKIEDLGITDGLAPQGGGVFNLGSLELQGVKVFGNSVESLIGQGGGIYSAGQLRLSETEVVFNEATLGDARGGGLYVATGGSAEVGNDSDLSFNEAVRGGGIFVDEGATLSVSRSDIRDNQAGDYTSSGLSQGAGIWTTGDTTVVDSTVSDNLVETLGGGLPASVGRGGGIYNGATGTLEVNRSAISRNIIDALANVLLGSSGGGLYNKGDATLLNSTVALNVIFAGLGGTNALWGAGIENDGGLLSLVNATVFRNQNGSIARGAGVDNDSGTVFMANSIVADQALGNDCGGAGSFVSLDHNIDSGGSCNLTAANDQPTTDPLFLDTLAAYGGPTEAVNLADGSPAIDMGDPAACPSTDQRGQIRVDVPLLGGGPCDIGAVEFNLLHNGMVEDDFALSKLEPDGWEGVGLNGASGLVCNNPRFAHNGRCAMKVRGKNSKTTDFVQEFDRSGVAGDTYELIVHYATRNAGAVSAQVIYTDSATGSIGLSAIFLTGGTHGYQTSTTTIFASLVGAVVYDKIKVILRANANGQVFWDDVSLVPN